MIGIELESGQNMTLSGDPVRQGAQKGSVGLHIGCESFPAIRAQAQSGERKEAPTPQDFNVSVPEIFGYTCIAASGSFIRGAVNLPPSLSSRPRGNRIPESKDSEDMAATDDEWAPQRYPSASI